MNKSIINTVLLLILSVLLGCTSASDKKKMTDIKVLGSHNSYKLEIDSTLKVRMEQLKQGSVYGLEYSHKSLTEQLDLGLRKLELDVVYDPEGGLYANPYGYVALKEEGLEVSDYDTEGVMNKPGFKVLHIPDIDFRSSCLTFIQCLSEIKEWSLKNPSHTPIAIMMNAKDNGVDRQDFVKPLQFDAIAFEAWDEEIRSIFNEDHLLTPDDVRGEYPTLEEAILEKGWPLVEETRGKVFFILDQSGEKMKTYIKDHPSLKGRVMFVNAPVGTPEAAFLVINDPVNDMQRIKEMVEKGYLVRTRADANTVQARNNDYSMFEAAKESGAQIISTDYYFLENRFGTNFKISLSNEE